MVGLRWQDVDLERGKAAIVQTIQRIGRQGLLVAPPKSQKGRRSIALDAFTVSVLKVHRVRQAEHRLNMGPAYEDRGLVFAGPLGQPMDPDALSHTWTRITRSIGLRGVRLHDLRHHHATLLLQEGVHPRVVQERLGHASIALTLDTYSHVLPGLQERAAEAFAQAMEDGRHEASS